MFRVVVFLFLFLYRIPAKKEANHSTVPAWVKGAGSHYHSTKSSVFFVNDYGAIPDSITLNTRAIQQAIDLCSAQGGGQVRFRKGTYLTGSIWLKSNVELEIGAGVTLLGSQDIKDYPEIDTRIAGIEMKWPAALINIIDQQNAAITGKGTVDGQGKPFWDLYWRMRKSYDPKGLRWIVDYDAKRPRTLLVADSHNILIRDITVMEAGFWTLQLLYSHHITVDHVTIRNNGNGHGPSTDGIDIDSSSWVLVENCDIDCNDDNFCLKAGRDWDGLRVNRPTEYIVIKNSVARAGDGLLTLGSETSGMIRHVYASGLTGLGTKNGLNIKSALTRGGGIDDIYFVDSRLVNVRTAFRISMNWNPSYSYSKLPPDYKADGIPEHWKKILHKVSPAERGIPVFQNVFVSNINVEGAGIAFTASGTKTSLLKNFRFNHVNIRSSTAGEVSFTKNWAMEQCNLITKDHSKLIFSNVNAQQ